MCSAAFKPIRRTTLRHRREMAHMEKWLAVATGTVAQNYDVAVEVLNARRLVKGYSDTHARGESKFDRVHRRRAAAGARATTAPTGCAGCATPR